MPSQETIDRNTRAVKDALKREGNRRCADCAARGPTVACIAFRTFAGGLLLLWVAWRMWREIHHGGESPGSPEIEGDEHTGVAPAKSFAAAAWAVAVADVSMSLDNVLAVAGAAREHPGILIVGLILSVALMGVAANIIAKYIERYRWIAYIGLAVILYVAVKMIYEGVVDPEVGITTLSFIPI